MTRLATILFALALLQSSSVWAQGASRAGKKKPKATTVGEWVYKKLSKAHGFLSKEQYQQALAVLEDIKVRKRVNAHERALMWQTYGFIYSAQEKYPEATIAFENCLAQEALPEGAALNTQFNLGQLYLSAGETRKAVRVLQTWLGSVKNPAPTALYVVAMAYAQNNDQKNALVYAKQAVARSSSPPESWLQLVLSLHFELKQYGDVVRVLKVLLGRFSKKSYWMQLSAVYAELGDERRALAVLVLAHEQGLLVQQSELLNLAQYYMSQGVPLRAAQVIEESLSAGLIRQDLRVLRFYSTALMYAREMEKAIEPLGRAGEMSDDGDLYVQLAQVYLGQEKWAEAVRTVQLALDKGGLTDAGNAYVLLGIANFSLGKRRPAREAFRQALDYERSQKTAKQWLQTLGAP